MPDAKSAITIFELAAGFLDTDGTLYDHVEMREMTGVEEDILSSKNREGDIKLGLILRNVTEAFVSKGPESKRITDKEKIFNIINCELTSMDMMAMLIALRRVSLGDLFRMRVKCPEEKCGQELEYDVNLAHMILTPMKDKKQRRYEIVLPSGKKMELALLTRKDEAIMDKARDKGEEILSYAIMARAKSIDGDTVISLDKVKALSYRDRQKIRAEYQAHEAGVDTEVEVKCRACGKKSMAELEVSQTNFFFPSEM